jgi:hypothetical protein
MGNGEMGTSDVNYAELIPNVQFAITFGNAIFSK